MYEQDLLEIYNQPLHFDKNLAPKPEMSGVNASCGDEVYLDFKVESGKFHHLKWRGEGCVISQVTTSLLIDKIMEDNLSVAQVLALDIQDLLGLINQATISPGRIKCLTLSLNVLKRALNTSN